MIDEKYLRLLASFAWDTNLSLASDAYLRTAIKHKNKIHVGHQGEAHRDFLARINLYDAPDTLTGFVNHKNHFLGRTDALPYAKENNLIKPNKKPGNILISEYLTKKKFPKDKIMNVESASDDWWKKLNFAEKNAYVKAHPDSTYANKVKRFDLPAPGTKPIPEGHVRLYHQTDYNNLPRIKHEGIRFDKAKGIEGPRAIYADKEGFYGEPRNTPTIEFHVPEKEFQSPFVIRDKVHPHEILSVHKPWHDTVRYLEEHPDIANNVLDGKHDDLMHKKRTGYHEDDKYIDAIRFFKKKWQ